MNVSANTCLQYKYNCQRIVTGCIYHNTVDTQWETWATQCKVCGMALV